MRAARGNLDVVAGSKIISGANTVFVNNEKLAVVTSATAKGDTIIAGSPTVFADNKQVARLGDATNKGRLIATGSPNVFVNQPNN